METSGGGNLYYFIAWQPRLFFAACISLCACCAGLAAEPAIHLGEWERVDRWLFEVESQWTQVGRKSRIDIARPNVRRIIAAAAPGDFYYYLGHQSFTETSWKHDPYCLELSFHNGDVLWHNPFHRMMLRTKIEVGSPYIKKVSRDVCFSIIPVWPLRDCGSPQQLSYGHSGILSEALSTREYRLKSEGAIVNGEYCVAVTSDDSSDRLWFAEGKGPCVVRREFYQPASGKLLQRINATRLTQIAPDLWLPTEFETTLFHLDEQPTLVSYSRIVNWKLGDAVDDGSVRATIKPGSISGKRTLGHFEQITPGGLALLDEIVDYLRNSLHLPRSRLHFAVVVHRLVRLLIGALVGAFLCSVGVPYYRRWRHRIFRG